MSTNSQKFHSAFISWAYSRGCVMFERGGNVNGRDSYVNAAVQLAWGLWQDVADGYVVIKPDGETP